MEKKKPGDCQIKEMKGAASKEDVKLKIEQVSLCLPRKSLSQITDTDFAETIETGNNNAWLVVSEAWQSVLSQHVWLQMCLFLNASYWNPLLSWVCLCDDKTS